jgi:hypothetical protein
MSSDTSGRRWSRAARAARRWLGAAALPVAGLAPASGPLWAWSPDQPAEPVTLKVDVIATPSSDGNGVLEPGESVIAAPSWTAPLGPIEMNGSASSFGGPGGPIYSLQDRLAKYGTIEQGQVKSCLETEDCYLLSVTVLPGQRPQQHWDATFTERTGGVTPPHVWTVHIGESFPDVPRNNAHYAAVEALLHNGVTGGCGGGMYCFGEEITRAELAVFTLAASEGPGYAPPPCVDGATMFADVPAWSPFCPWIEELARRGIVSGQGYPPMYNPAGWTNRGLMAYVVIATRDPNNPPPPCIEGEPREFPEDDVPWNHPYCPWIEALAPDLDNLNPGILDGGIGGCNSNRFCPDEPPALREESASFQVAGFGLKLHH